MNDLQTYQFLSKYARWDGQRRERYIDAVTRTLRWLDDAVFKETGHCLLEMEYYRLWQAMMNMEAFPSLRLFQMAGPALDRCHVGLYNCSATALDSWTSFAELMYNLMQGTGVGFSVEAKYICQLPPIRRYWCPNVVAGTHPIKDTTEGWCEALLYALNHYASGSDIDFDYSLIRPAGARLVTKGGFASGPEPLRKLLEFVRSVFSKYWVGGGRLTSLDCHSIACCIGDIVVVGGVRRSALISLSDLWDESIRDCKSGDDWYSRAPYLAGSNNSAVYGQLPTWKEFSEEWEALRSSGSGERGIFNQWSARELRGEREDEFFLTNPCGEIHLRNGQFCNLSRAICRPSDTFETLREKVITAVIFGTLQSCLTNFGYLREHWKRNCEEERLLGVTLDGALDCPLLRPTNEDRGHILRELRKVAWDTNAEWADKLGINKSVAITCMQPGGNGPLLFDTASGVHCRYAPYYMRRFRASAMDPLSIMLKEQGVNWYPENGQSEECHSTCVFEFPVASPAGIPTRNDLDAIEQFHNWLDFKENWTDHNPSVTIYVKDDEWDGLGKVVYDNFGRVGGLSFLPADSGTYQLTVYLEISEQQYREAKAKEVVIDWERLVEYEKSDMKIDMGGPECIGPACAIT